jgi:ketosteroid isomerase-like protein
MAESANVAFVRRTYDLVNAGDFEALAAGFEPGFEWSPDQFALSRTPRNTADDVVSAVDDFTAAFADFRTEIDELIEEGDHVIAVVRHLGRVGGGDVARRETHLWTFADGRPRSLREFEELDAALEAARGSTRKD